MENKWKSVSSPHKVSFTNMRAWTVVVWVHDYEAMYSRSEPSQRTLNSTQVKSLLQPDGGHARRELQIMQRPTENRSLNFTFNLWTNRSGLVWPRKCAASCAIGRGAHMAEADITVYTTVGFTGGPGRQPARPQETPNPAADTQPAVVHSGPCRQCGLLQTQMKSKQMGGWFLQPRCNAVEGPKSLSFVLISIRSSWFRA